MSRDPLEHLEDDCDEVQPCTTAGTSSWMQSALLNAQLDESEVSKQQLLQW